MASLAGPLRLFSPCLRRSTTRPSAAQPRRRMPKNCLQRERLRQMHPHRSRPHLHLRTDLQQPRTDRHRQFPRHLRARQTDPPERAHQHMSVGKRLPIVISTARRSGTHDISWPIGFREPHCSGEGAVPASVLRVRSKRRSGRRTAPGAGCPPGRYSCRNYRQRAAGA